MTFAEFIIPVFLLAVGVAGAAILRLTMPKAKPPKNKINISMGEPLRRYSVVGPQSKMRSAYTKSGAQRASTH